MNRACGTYPRIKGRYTRNELTALATSKGISIKDNTGRVKTMDILCKDLGLFDMYLLDSSTLPRQQRLIQEVGTTTPFIKTRKSIQAKFIDAIESNSPDIVRKMLEKGVSNNLDDALEIAVEHGHSDIVLLLLTHGANPNNNSILSNAIITLNYNLVKLLLPYANNPNFKESDDNITDIMEYIASTDEQSLEKFKTMLELVEQFEYEDISGVKHTCPDIDVCNKAKYRKMLLKYHPDKHKGGDAEGMTNLIVNCKKSCK